MKNYPYGEILGTLGPDLGPYISILIFENNLGLERPQCSLAQGFSLKGAMSKGGTLIAFCLLRFSLNTRSGPPNYVLGPQKSDSSSKTTPVVRF